MGLMHCGGMRISCSGRPREAACWSRRVRRTPCMLMRSYSSVMVLRRPVTQTSARCLSACRARALSLPPLQQKRTGVGLGWSCEVIGVDLNGRKAAPLKTKDAAHKPVAPGCKLRCQGRSMLRPYEERSVAASEAIGHTDAELAT